MTSETQVAAFSEENVVGSDHSLSRDRISPRIKGPVTSANGWELASESLFIASRATQIGLCVVARRLQLEEIYQLMQLRVGLYGDETVSSSS